MSGSKDELQSWPDVMSGYGLGLSDVIFEKSQVIEMKGEEGFKETKRQLGEEEIGMQCCLGHNRDGVD